MAHTYRFLAQKSDSSWLIIGEELHHLRKVLRLTKGDTVEVVNGNGVWAKGTIETIDSKAATIKSEEESEETPPPYKISLAVGALKPGLVDDILPPLVEVGVDRIYIFGQDDMAKFRISDKALTRWKRIILSAIKQSKRCWLPTISIVESADDLIKESYDKRYIFTKSEASIPMISDESQPSGDVLAVVGGEKGFSSREEGLFLSSGFEPRTLGPHVLRAVTAAVVSVSTLAAQRFTRS